MNDIHHIALVEDNPDDAELSLRAFARQQPQCKVDHFADGNELLGQLHESDGQKPPPSLVLLDLKMPQRDGISTLKALREHEYTRNLPVVVVSSSNQLSDIRAAYEAGANSYVRKPVEYEVFCSLLSRITDYWLNVNWGVHAERNS